MTTLRSALVLKTIVDLIIDNGPGWTLPPQEKLCDKLKISRTALREVLAVLEFTQIITCKPKVGTIVNPLEEWKAFSVSVQEWRTRAKEIHGAV